MYGTVEEWNTRPIEDALRKQLEVAVEALRRIYRDDGSMYSLIAHEALAEIERIGAEK